MMILRSGSRPTQEPSWGGGGRASVPASPNISQRLCQDRARGDARPPITKDSHPPLAISEASRHSPRRSAMTKHPMPRSGARRFLPRQGSRRLQTAKGPAPSDMRATSLAGGGWSHLPGTSRARWLPLPARDERGEGWGEGFVNSATKRLAYPSPLPSPHSCVVGRGNSLRPWWHLQVAPGLDRQVVNHWRPGVLVCMVC
jgi:hypothetical protein